MIIPPLLTLTKRAKYAIIIIAALLLFSCDHPLPKQSEILGTWKSDDGAILRFGTNQKLTVTNLQASKFNSSESGIFSGHGSWEVSLENNVSPWQMLDVYAKNERRSVGNNLIIERESYTTGGGSIHYMFVWIGDPDSEDRYKFYKVK